jgi:TonB family protein
MFLGRNAVAANLVASACLVATVVFAAGFPWPVSAATQTSSPRLKRWMQFELMESEESGVVRVNKDLVLSITVGGIPTTTDSILASIESVAFQSQTLSLSQDSSPATYQGTAILEPKQVNKSLTTVHPKATRIRVTLARPKTAGLEEFMKRDVYITLGEATGGDGEDENDSPRLVMPEPADSDAKASAKALETGSTVNITIAEEDLLPLPGPTEAEAYWKQVSGLISRNWSRQVRQIRRAPSGETVRVQFKLYSSGVAQLIQVEKSSGARDINEAGIQSIIHAHPFPPLPADMNGKLVDVHVRMRTGVKVGPGDVETTIEKKPAKAAPVVPKPHSQ